MISKWNDFTGDNDDVYKSLPSHFSCEGSSSFGLIKSNKAVPLQQRLTQRLPMIANSPTGVPLTSVLIPAMKSTDSFTRFQPSIQRGQDKACCDSESLFDSSSTT